MSATPSPSPLGRSAHRAGSALLIAVVCGGVVSLLFANPEPAALASDPPAQTITTTTTTAAVKHPPVTAPTPAAAAASSTTAPAATKTGASTPSAATTDPRMVAAGWYATRHQLPADKVKVLQADQLTRNRIRVLLMVQRAKGRLDSAVVTVTRGKTGWKVASRR